MQLSIITGCEVQLKVYNREDSSLVEYQSDENILKVKKDNCAQYVKFTKENYELCSQIENLVSKFGHLNDRKSDYVE